jgi:hypothetical protein
MDIPTFKKSWENMGSKYICHVCAHTGLDVICDIFFSNLIKNICLQNGSIDKI